MSNDCSRVIIIWNKNTNSVESLEGSRYCLKGIQQRQNFVCWDVPSKFTSSSFIPAGIARITGRIPQWESIQSFCPGPPAWRVACLPLHSACCCSVDPRPSQVVWGDCIPRRKENSGSLPWRKDPHNLGSRLFGPIDQSLDEQHRNASRINQTRPKIAVTKHVGIECQGPNLQVLLGDRVFEWNRFINLKCTKNQCLSVWHKIIKNNPATCVVGRTGKGMIPREAIGCTKFPHKSDCFCWRSRRSGIKFAPRRRGRRPDFWILIHPRGQSCWKPRHTRDIEMQSRNRCIFDVQPCSGVCKQKIRTFHWVRQGDLAWLFPQSPDQSEKNLVPQWAGPHLPSVNPGTAKQTGQLFDFSRRDRCIGVRFFGSTKCKRHRKSLSRADTWNIPRPPQLSSSWPPHWDPQPASCHPVHRFPPFHNIHSAGSYFCKRQKATSTKPRKPQIWNCLFLLEENTWSYLCSWWSIETVRIWWQLLQSINARCAELKVAAASPSSDKAQLICGYTKVFVLKLAKNRRKWWQKFTNILWDEWSFVSRNGFIFGGRNTSVWRCGRCRFLHATPSSVVIVIHHNPPFCFPSEGLRKLKLIFRFSWLVNVKRQSTIGVEQEELPSYAIKCRKGH